MSYISNDEKIGVSFHLPALLRSEGRLIHVRLGVSARANFMVYLQRINLAWPKGVDCGLSKSLDLLEKKIIKFIMLLRVASSMGSDFYELLKITNSDVYFEIVNQGLCPLKVVQPQPMCCRK